jgi:hypothetical protein
MQVTLTPHAEELLRSALARNPEQSPSEIVEQALVQRLEHNPAPALTDPVWDRLKCIPGVKLPTHWPPRFKPVYPLKVEGELPSERLIRERR